jgi:hypothetical protein
MLASKLIVVELNEVPYKVVDNFHAKHPDSALAKFLKSSDQYVTLTEDEIQLDPWISWPTLHRGVPDSQHQILHLGQSTETADSKYPPIWRILKDNGKSVGVFGSLHSCMERQRLDSYSFFLPDFFASKSFAYPERLMPLQDFNLRMTRESARNVSSGVAMKEAAKFLLSAPKLGVGIDTARRIAQQLNLERGDKRKKNRRRNIQCSLLSDVFLSEVNRTLPDYATFYTNHVAAAMHRYWAASFPESQIGPSLDKEWLRAYADEVDVAMETFDALLKMLMTFQRRHPEYLIVVASSLGQTAIPAVHTREFLTIIDIARFMRALGAPDGSWTTIPAMVPDFAVSIDPEHIDTVTAALMTLSVDGERMLRQESRMSHSAMRVRDGIRYLHHDVDVGDDFKPPLAFDVREGRTIHVSFQWDSYDGPRSALLGNRSLDFDELGLGFTPHQDGVNCTAQHAAEGCLMVFPGVSDVSGRQLVSTLDFAPSVLGNFGLEGPSYMRGRPRIAFRQLGQLDRAS